MLRISIFLLLLAGTIGCKSDEEKSMDDFYKKWKAKIDQYGYDGRAKDDADWISQFHYDEGKQKEAADYIKSYNEYIKNLNKKADEEREFREKIESLGGYRLVEIYTKTKCNLFEGTYQLNKEVSDSASLALLAKYLAQQLFEKSEKNNACTYPLMSQVLIFQPKEKDRDNWAAMCTVSPSNYDGEVTVKKINKG